MAIPIHIARIALMPVNSVGVVINKNQATISEMMQASSEERVIADSTIPNTASNPTPKAYLELEAASGYIPSHIDQTYIITYTGSALTSTTPASMHSVTAGNPSALLSSLFTINANLRAITLKPRTSKTVYVNMNAVASASTFELVPIFLSIPKAIADTIYVYSVDSGPNLDVIQHI